MTESQMSGVRAAGFKVFIMIEADNDGAHVQIISRKVRSDIAVESDIKSIADLVIRSMSPGARTLQ